MPRRSRDWNIQLSKDLQDRDYAREFILASLDEGLSLQQVLAKVIRLYGIKEFAKEIAMAASNLSRAIDLRSNPTRATLNKLVQPFGLELAVMPISKKPKKRS